MENKTIPTFEDWKKENNKAAISSNLVATIAILIALAATLLCSCAPDYFQNRHGCATHSGMRGY